MQKKLKLSWACTIRLLRLTYALVKNVLVTDTYFCTSLMLAPKKEVITIMAPLSNNIQHNNTEPNHTQYTLTLKCIFCYALTVQIMTCLMSLSAHCAKQKFPR